MSRSYQEQVEVRLGEPILAGVRLEPGWCRGVVDEEEVEVPTAFLWRGRLLVVHTVLARWTQRIPWWRGDGRGELEHEVWRVEAGRGRAYPRGVYELSLVAPDAWRLERVCD